MASFAGEEPRLPPPRRTRSLEMPHGLNKKAGFSEIAAAAAANAAKEHAGFNSLNFSQNNMYENSAYENNMYGGYDAMSDAAILHERLSALRSGGGVSHVTGPSNTLSNIPSFLNNSNTIPGGSLTPIDRMPSLVSWGQTLTVDPSKGGLSLRNNPGVPPLPPSPHAPSSGRGRPNSSSSPFAFGEETFRDVRDYSHGIGLPPPPQRHGWMNNSHPSGVSSGVSNIPGLSNYQGGGGGGGGGGDLSSGMGEIPWANGGQENRVPSLLARTSSAPPLGALMKLGDIIKGGGDMNDLHTIYRNVSEASTPDISPSRSPLTVQSAALSPERERERRPLPMGLPRTKLSRTSSCPPLGDVLEDSELASTESDGDGEVGSSGKERKRGSKFQNKRKRPIPLPEGIPKGRSTPPREGQRSPTNSQKSAGDRTDSKTADDEDIEEDDNDNLSPEGEDLSGMRGGSRRSEKDKRLDSPKDYIHVRARRGQATDSHSLAERVRREKISERMKVLQDLVPTCSKVTGKALMLDEIINYVRSLQLQVELLSRKLAAIGHEAEMNNMSEGSLIHQQEQQQDILSDTKSPPRSQNSIDLGAFQQLSHDGNNRGNCHESSGISGGSLSQSEMRSPGMDGLSSVNSLDIHLAQGGILQDMLLGSTRGIEGLAIDPYQSSDVLGDLHHNMGWDGELNSFVDCTNPLQTNMQEEEHGIYVKQEP